ADNQVANTLDAELVQQLAGLDQRTVGVTLSATDDDLVVAVTDGVRGVVLHATGHGASLDRSQLIHGDLVEVVLLVSDAHSRVDTASGELHRDRGLAVLVELDAVVVTVVAEGVGPSRQQAGNLDVHSVV